MFIDEMAQVGQVMSEFEGLIFSAILTAALTTVTSLLVQRYIIKKEFEKIDYQSQNELRKVIAEKIILALEETRRLASKTAEIEIYSDNIEFTNELNSAKDNAVYPSIFTDSDTYFEFINEIGDARAEYELYLKNDVRAYLYYMERYLFHAVQFATKHEFSFPLTGAILIKDLEIWRNDLINIIVDDLNSPSLKLDNKNDASWEKAKKKMDILWESSILYKLNNNIDEEMQELFNAIIQEQKEEIRNDEE